MLTELTKRQYYGALTNFMLALVISIVAGVIYFVPAWVLSSSFRHRSHMIWYWLECLLLWWWPLSAAAWVISSNWYVILWWLRTVEVRLGML